MSNPQRKHLIQEAATLIRNRQFDEAADILGAFLQENPESENGWFLLSYAVSEPQKKEQCLERVLNINPNNARARERLLKLQGKLQFQETSLREGMPKKKKRAASQAVRILVVILLIGSVIGAGGLGIWVISQNLSQTFLVASHENAAPSPSELTSTPFPSPTFEPSSTEALDIPVTPSLSATIIVLSSTESQFRTPDVEMSQLMDNVQNQVSTIRELGILVDNPRYVISQSQVRDILKSIFQERHTRESLQDKVRVLSVLGLVNPTYDLYLKSLNDLGEGLGGGYFPWSDELFVIGDGFSGIEKFVYAHEYVHSLVDQHYHLDEVGVYPECLHDTDRCSSIAALVEGDATSLMYKWLESYASEEEIAEIEQAQFSPINEAITSEDFPPPYAIRDMHFKYVDGENFVNYLLELGGWGLVNEAYRNMPTSSEQILHPEKYLSGEIPLQVDARDLDDILGGDWRHLTTETLGELTTQMILGYGENYLVQLDTETAENAAAGWGGDSYQVFYRGKSNQYILSVHWRWDNIDDAIEFWDAMQIYQNKRYLNKKVDSDYDCWTKINDHFSCIYRTQNNTLWLMAPTMELIDALFAEYPEFE